MFEIHKSLKHFQQIFSDFTFLLLLKDGFPAITLSLCALVLDTMQIYKHNVHRCAAASRTQPIRPFAQTGALRVVDFFSLDDLLVLPAKCTLVSDNWMQQRNDNSRGGTRSVP